MAKTIRELTVLFLIKVIDKIKDQHNIMNLTSAELAEMIMTAKDEKDADHRRELKRMDEEKRFKRRGENGEFHDRLTG